ncbi:5-formyltetrahydrofolate cyclo-ligase [Alkalicoccus daliensis]|uniref:5-formyltetrahydrofolate cyclo-ligase n=1 Tax=Alkalicoccus daliensis TaxID=745820 RepID=A0A1H0B8D1_9BACI|nr:5-formyltetrahydrofolate cyclo-ligase [Alkalicoccus daliensis]SDN41879.1 5-formyltetrahydrofolate cyclo-ligase [Alkalicoccus daliensis]
MKTQIRQKMLSYRKNTEIYDKKDQEQLLYKQLFEHEAWKHADVIAVTISVGDELDTYPIIQKAWKEGKTVAAPVVNKNTRQLDFYSFTDFSECRKASFGLIEPDPSKTGFCAADMLELIITPGLAFNKEGYRIGYGGGYYDKLLSRTSGYSISLCFDFQLVEHIPVETFDQPVNEILTP